MDDVCEDGEFSAFLDIVLLPVVGELVAGVLAPHALLDPLLGAPLPLPVFAGAVERDDGSAISLMRSCPTLASHSLTGSALGLGTDWTMRSMVSASATSVSLFLPSWAVSFNRLQFVTTWLPSFFRRFLRTFQ